MIPIMLQKTELTFEWPIGAGVCNWGQLMCGPLTLPYTHHICLDPLLMRLVYGDWDQSLWHFVWLYYGSVVMPLKADIDTWCSTIQSCNLSTGSLVYVLHWYTIYTMLTSVQYPTTIFIYNRTSLGLEIQSF